MLKKQQEDLLEQSQKQKEELLEQNKKQVEALQKEQEQKQKEETKIQTTVNLDSTKKATGPNVFDTLKSRVQKFTKGFNLFKPEIKAGKTVTFNTWIEENKIPKEIAFKFERVHRTRIAKLVKQDESSVSLVHQNITIRKKY